MWPKAIAQLLELLPHAKRLLPLVDRFFQAGVSGDESIRKAMDSLDALRTDLAKAMAAHEGLYRQLNEQSGKMSEALSEMRAARAAAEVAETRVTRLESRLDRMGLLLLLIAVMALALLVICVILLYRTHG